MVWIVPAGGLTAAWPRVMMAHHTDSRGRDAPPGPGSYDSPRPSRSEGARPLPDVRPLAAGQHDAVRSRRLSHRDRGRAGTGAAKRMAAAGLGRGRPEFADEREAKAVLGAIMTRYNEILDQIADDTFDPIFWATRDGTLIAADWAEGFLQAIMLRLDAWDRLLKSKRDGHLLIPILALCGEENGESLLGLSP